MSLKETRFCVTCHKSNVPDFKHCSKCKVVLYCSRSCQKKDFNVHKVICESIGRELGWLQRLEESFKSLKLDPSSEPVNVWETYIGRFSELTDYRDWSHEDFLHSPQDRFPVGYLEWRETHSFLVWTLADKYESYEMTQTYLLRLLETLRLDAADTNFVRYRIPLVFILLGNAYQFKVL